MNFGFDWKKMYIYYIPNIVRFRAQTSKRAVLNSFMRQWYWNWCCFAIEQFCLMVSQFKFLAAISQDCAFDGHFETYLIFVADSLQKVNDEPLLQTDKKSKYN